MLKLTILSSERQLVKGVNITEIILTGSKGQLQILPGHAPIVGLLQPGIFRYKENDGQTVSGFISVGFFSVQENHVKVIVENLETKDEIDLNRAKKAQAIAEENLKNYILDEKIFKKYQLKLQRALIRQQAAK